MDINQFIHMYGKHKLKILNTNYATLSPGDIILPGDEAWTWLTPDCQESGWLRVPKEWHHTECAAHMVEIRRALKYHIVSGPAYDDRPALPGQIVAIESMQLEHDLLYGLMCHEALRRIVRKRDLTIKQARAVLEGGRTLTKRRKARMAQAEELNR